MSAALPSGAVPDPAVARAERHMAHLAELAEIGMDLAREVRRQALDQSADAPSAGEFALTFSRIARAVRQTVALEARLAEGGLQRASERSGLSVSDRWRSVRRKRQVRDIVGEMIDAEVGEFDHEGVGDDLNERLEDGDEDADFADRPIGELVARICRDIGVTPDWSLFQDQDWAIEEARVRPPGSPFAVAGSEEGRDEASPDPPRPTHDPPGTSH